MKYRRKERGHYSGESPKRGLISVKDLPIEFPEGCESPYHRLDNKVRKE